AIGVRRCLSSHEGSGGRQVVGVAVRIAVAHLLRAVGVDVVRPDQRDVAVVVAGHQLDVAAVVEDAHVAGLGLRCGHHGPAFGLEPARRAGDGVVVPVDQARLLQYCGDEVGAVDVVGDPLLPRHIAYAHLVTAVDAWDVPTYTQPF